MATILITGCSSGFGRSTATTLADRGHTVVATMRDLAKAGDLAGRDGVHLVTLDVNDETSVQVGVAAAIEAVGPLDVVVNNAGIEFHGPLEHTSDTEVRAQFETNVFGPLRVIRAVLPGMRERRAGLLVNVSSLAGIVARPYGGIYAASKHAIEAISEALYSELAQFGIRVAVVEPGQFHTSLEANAARLASFGPDSAYWASFERFEAALPSIAGPDGPGDARQVADVIAGLVETESRPLRTLVGADAELVAGVQRSGSFEEFEQTMRTALDWWE